MVENLSAKRELEKILENSEYGPNKPKPEVIAMFNVESFESDHECEYPDDCEYDYIVSDDFEDEFK